MNLKTSVGYILPKKDCLNISIHEDEVCIEYGGMYSAPEVSLSQMNALCDLFGANDIKVKDGNSQEGCESCDYGSLYCVDIKIIGATKNLDKIEGEF